MAKRKYGTGHIYEKSGSYYGRWWTIDGRQLNRKVGPLRSRDGADGLTRARGQPLRTIQEFLGHADSKTTQIYAYYAPSEREVQMVNEAFAPEVGGLVANRNQQPVATVGEDS